MIDKRRSQNLHLHKHPLHTFRSDHQSMSSIKLLPILDATPNSFCVISPFSPNNDLFMHQAIYFPLNPRHTLGVLFQADRVAKYSRRRIGLSYEYQNMHDSKFKAVVGFGGNANVAVEWHKKIRRHLILSVYGSVMENYRDHISGVAVGVKYKDLEVKVGHKPGFCDTVSAEYTVLQFISGVRLSVYGEALLYTYGQYPESGGIPLREAEVRLTYPSGKYQASIILNAFKLDTLRIHFNKKTRFGRLGITVQCNTEGQSVFYFVVNRENFKLSIPFLAVNSPIPLALFGIAYIVGFMKKKPLQVQQKQKMQQDRMKQLRLIDDRAAENYRRQKNQNGLVIIEAYYGQAETITQIAAGDKPAWLLEPQGERKFYDVTVPLRFYVENGNLRIMANNREWVYGFCRTSRDALHKTLIVYQPKGQPGVIHRRVFGDFQQILL